VDEFLDRDFAVFGGFDLIREVLEVRRDQQTIVGRVFRKQDVQRTRS
jgi:hypothetical protein